MWPGYRATANASILNAYYTSPAVITEVWSWLTANGVTAGHGFEPGCGRGDWITAAPKGLTFDAVDIDPVTVKVARLLTGANVVEARIEEWDVTRSSRPEVVGYDLVVGNVPFSSIRPGINNPHRDNLHNLAVARSVEMLRPGGVATVLTSRFALDADASQGWRTRLAEQVDLIAAIRLPAGTHHSAGTDVVTDLLILRRPLPGETRPTPEWIDIVPLELAGETFRHNRHFAVHPDHVLGVYQPGGAYRRENLNVFTDQPVERVLADALSSLTVDYRPGGDAPQPVRQATMSATGRRLPAGSIVVDTASPTGFSRDARPHKVSKAGHARLTALCALRDLALDYLDAPTDDGRQELAALYAAYRADHPPLNHYTLSTSGDGADSDVDDVDPDSGEVTRARRRYPRYDGFRSDPSWWTVAALEEFDDETGIGTPAPILQHPIIDPHRDDRWPTSAASMTLAVANSLARFHRLDVGYVADQLSVDHATATARLGEVAFEDPVGGWELAATYLAGDVVGKLDQAEAAARSDDRYKRNVDALRAVLPTPLTQAEITPELGVTWLSAEDVTLFVRELTGSTSVTVYYHPPTGRWSTDGWAAPGPAQFRTERHDLTDQVVRACNATPVTVMSTFVDGNGREHRVVNADATAAEQLARDNLNEAVQRWCWSNPERAGQLVARYNRLYNRYQPVHYDGTHLTLPGLSTGFKPRPHQKDVVWRVLTATDSGTLMAHGVGAGKTAAMIIAGQEARRTGRVTGTTLYAVPGNMVEQFARDYLGLYPAARVITPRATDRDSLREFTARVATGDFDAAICSHQAVKKIPLHPDTERAQLQRRVDDFDSTDPNTTLSRSARRNIEKRLEALRQQLTKLTNAAVDPTVTYFDRMNVGMLFVDEAHLAKNIALNTVRQGLPLPEPSQLAEAILARADIVRDLHGPSAVVMATATPVTNSPAEMWVTARLVSPAALAKAGMGHFDAFAANFLSPVETIEHTASGKLKMVTRLADYRNFPDLARMFRSFTDIRQTDQLGFDLPTLTGGQATVHVVEPSDQQLQVAGWARERANGMHTNPGGSNRVVDPVIAILGVARAAALHPATISPATLERWATTGYPNLRFDWDAPNPKLAEAADTIARIHHTTSSNQYPGSTVTGAVQVVFCDQGVPNPTGGPSVYSTLTGLLVDHGVPRAQIGWVHDWPDPATRQPLWDQTRRGQIRVLIGSTQQMGVGVNIQTRLYAAHELTAPYRPDWLTQAEGRMIRQGNHNTQVELHRYVSERTADATSWQILQRKAHFIHTAMSHPDTLTRDLRDESVQTPAEEFAQIAALATGDQRHIELAALTATVTRLERGERAHHASIHNQQHTIRDARQRIDTLHQHIGTLTGLTPRLSQEAVALGRKILDIDPGSYTLHIDGVPYRTRTDHDGLRLTIVDTDVTIRISHARLRPADEGRGLGTTIINAHRQLPERINELRQQLERTTRQHDAELARPVPTDYPRAGELAAARQRRTELAATLQPDPPSATAAVAAAVDDVAGVPAPTLAERWAAIGAYRPYDARTPPHWGNRARGEQQWAAAVNRISVDPGNQHPSRRHEIGIFHGVALVARISATTVHIGPRAAATNHTAASYETTPGQVNPDDLARWLAHQHRLAMLEQNALRAASTTRTNTSLRNERTAGPQPGR